MPSTTTNALAVSSLVFADGADYYTQIYEKWSAGNFDANNSIAAPGRFGYGQRITTGIGGYGTTFLSKALSGGPYNRLVFGFACRIESTNPPATAFGSFIDSQGNPICSIAHNALGRITFSTVSGFSIDSSPNVIPYNQWFYVEMDCIFSGGTRSVSVRVNGLEVINSSNVTFGSITNSFGIGFFMTGPFPYNGAQHSFDDIYVLAPSVGTVGDSFLGDIKVVALLPNGVGRVTGFTQTGGISGSNYTSVNDVPPDGDNSFVSSNVVGTVDSYLIPPPNAITPVTQIFGVSVYALGRKDDSPSRFISCGVGNGVTENFDAGSPLGSGYAYVQRVFPINPLTGLPWTLTDFDTLQLAIKLTG